MKAITDKQPWASLIVEGIKDVENRTWPCPKKYIGKRVLIHAGISKTLDHIPLDGIFSEQQLWNLRSSFTEIELCKRTYPHGAIIGSVEIVDCVINHPSIWAEDTNGVVNKVFFDPKVYVKKEWILDSNGNYVHKKDAIYNWVLANPIKFPEPIPAKGKLGFWDFKPDEKYFGCTNDNGYSNQSCGEKIGCPQDCSECDYNRFIYDKDI